MTLNEELPQFETVLLKSGDTAPLFHGGEENVCAVVLNNYYSHIPLGMTLKECSDGYNAGVIAFKKLQPLYPSTVFFLFGLKGTSTLSGEPHLVRMEPALDIVPSQLVPIVAKGLKVRRTKSTSTV